MIQLWLIAVLILPLCKDANKKRKMKDGYIAFADQAPSVTIDFASSLPPEMAFSLGRGEDGMVVGVLSRGRPDFSVAGDTACYEVQSGTVSFMVGAPSEVKPW